MASPTETWFCIECGAGNQRWSEICPVCGHEPEGIECELAENSFPAPVIQSASADRALLVDEGIESFNWYCDICGDGPRSSQDDDCPGCGHQRCATCHSESKPGLLLRRTTPANLPPTESNDVRMSKRALIKQPFMTTTARPGDLASNVHRNRQDVSNGDNPRMSSL